MLRQAACAVSLAAALAAVASGCGGGGDKTGQFEPSAPAPPTTTAPIAAPAPPPAATTPLDSPTDPHAASIASRLTAAGYAVHAFRERFRRPSDDVPGPRPAQDFAGPSELLTVTDPGDDRKVEQLRRQLFAVDSTVSRQGTMATPAQTTRIQELVAGIQNQFRVEVAVYPSAADAAADQRDARQPFTSPREVVLVTHATRKGTVVYRLTVAEDVGDRYDAAFRKVVEAAEGA